MSSPLEPTDTSPPRETGTDLDRAQYLSFALTWGVSIRMSHVPGAVVEDRLVDFFRRLCRQLEPAVVLEIGAHEASFARWAARALPEARVIAFEANPHVHEKFRRKLSRTAVDYRHLAVGPVNGEIQLNLPTAVHGRKRELTSRMASLGRHTAAAGEIQVSVPSVRLDDFLTLDASDRVVAWIDVEGASGSVLEASAATLARADAVYIEVEQETTWEDQWLDSDVAVFLRRLGLVPVARDRARRHQYNVVFVRSHLAEQRRTARQAAAMLWDPVED